ncbi:MAG: N-formylglutamate amidohydrolase [Bauldia sp.]|uniref:N-formylglutamate amidohydrolase n=1 Tax=Bauldia sp. TaxID=2575872 RepID=UPI001DC9F36E|nr:N-formylglutamate amidohydrolase [Bauldia sp.]MCB1496945.1 N-formylglutamate amidohydrolase [Bauldia sp.]
MAERDTGPVVVENADGGGAFVVLCDHASNTVPRDYGSLGLPPDALETHIAWDPGALGVARRMSADLDAPLIWPKVSRLVVDCNRDPSAPDLIVQEGDGRPVPGNLNLTEAGRARRIQTVHAPYHAAIEAVIDRRLAAGTATALIAIHSFTPIFYGEQRPWQIGVVFDEDLRLSSPLIGRLTADAALTVGINKPYSPADRVYYTMERHSGGGRLPAVMIEIRNDEVATPAAQRGWGDRLSKIFEAIAPEVRESGNAAA